MQTKEYTFIDRTGWPDGPWKSECDKVQWQDAATGLPCIARRVPMGHWCGYVGVSEGHPFFGKRHDEINGLLSAHGDINSAKLCDPREGEHHVCHVPDPGEPDHVWWIGFDCGHAGDLSPGMLAMLGDIFSLDCETYRTLDYVKQVVALLAQQLAEAAS